MGIILIVIGTFFKYKEGGNNVSSNYEYLPLVSFVIYFIGFAVGFGPIPWLMMGEILPGKHFIILRLIVIGSYCFIKTSA